MFNIVVYWPPSSVADLEKSWESFYSFRKNFQKIRTNSMKSRSHILLKFISKGYLDNKHQVNFVI